MLSSSLSIGFDSFERYSLQQIFWTARLRQSASSSASIFNRLPPRCPNCLRWTSCTGPSSRSTSALPAGVILAITVRRSCTWRCREIRPRFSSRSSSRVMSGSRVISRLPISPDASPSGDPRRILSTLYCVIDRSSGFSTLAMPRDRISVVRKRSKNAPSSRLGFRSVLFASVTSPRYPSERLLSRQSCQL